MQQYAQYLEFIKNHWLLVLAFFILLGVIIFEESRSKGGGKGIAPQKALDLINHENALIIDLRDQHLFMNGHILGSVHIFAKDSAEIIKKIEMYKGRAIILLGKDDNSAVSLQTKLRKEGFADVYVLQGGITAWKNASLPVTKK